MWGFPPAILGLLSGNPQAVWLVPTITLAFGVSPYIARLFVKYWPRFSSWRVTEFVRGALVGIGVMLI